MKEAIRVDRLILKSPTIEELQDLDIAPWLKNRNQVLVNFLLGVSGHGDIGNNIKKDYAIGKAVEHVYYIQNCNSVLPLTLSENIVSYGVTHSKLATNIKSKSSPAGSYTHVKTVLANQSCEALPPPEGDALYVFDNDQTL